MPVFLGHDLLNLSANASSALHASSEIKDKMQGSSADEERAILLRDDVQEHSINRTPDLFERVNLMTQEPFTPLTKILLAVGLFLLLVCSVFIGLFAGAHHKLGLSHDPVETITVTSIVTATQISTSLPSSTIMLPPLPEPTKEKICNDPSCIILSASILSSLDLSQDPCENFYDFANGGWLQTHPLPADKGIFGSFELLARENKQIIKGILEKPSSISHSDDEILLKLRNFFDSCLNEDHLNDIGLTPLSEFVGTIKNLYNKGKLSNGQLGAEEHTSGLTSALSFLHSRGINSLFSFDIKGDSGIDPNLMVLWFNQPELGLLSKEYYKEKPVVEFYINVVERILLALIDLNFRGETTSSQKINSNRQIPLWPPWPWPPWGSDDDRDENDPVNKTFETRELAEKVVQFETKLAEASLDLDILRQDPVFTYNPVPFFNLTNTIPQIHFPTYLSTLTPRFYPDRVILTYPAFAVSLSDILDETSSDVVEAYLITRSGLTLAPYLSVNTEVWQAHRSLTETLTGIKKGVTGDRAEYCISVVENALGFATGRYFVNETFGGASQEKSAKIVSDLVKSIKDSLKSIDWMDDKSALAALQKADAIRVKIGYPVSPDTRDPLSIASYYRDVKSDKINFFGNILSSRASDGSKKWSQLGRRRDADAWELFPSTVNAYFNPHANEIVFPAGILRPPFFSQEWPAYLSYGSFGHVASHELTHAFDNAGRLYNKDGMLVQWWSNFTIEGFKVKQDCIVKQYSLYAIDDGKGGNIFVNGNLTSGENIGDMGLIQAYRAWKDQLSSENKDANYLLPGLNFTKEQLFFISFARIWARAINPAAAVQLIRTDSHSPTRFRVDGTVSNIPEFARAFKCSEGSKLNPPRKNRCIFWS